MTKSWSDEYDSAFGSGCFCVGPQNGQPLCPCGMRSKYSEEHIALAMEMAYRRAKGITPPKPSIQTTTEERNEE